MKILIMSDSHSALSFMRRCVEAVEPDVVIHLGDHYDDGAAMGEEYPDIRLYQVPGNCDRYRCPPDIAQTQLVRVDGVRLLLTHGHLHRVKQYLDLLLRDGHQLGVQAVLYGHTHIPNCYQEPEGMWVVNPGSCGYFGGTVALMETAPGQILGCRILREEDL